MNKQTTPAQSVITSVSTELYDGWTKRPAENIVARWKGGKISLQNFMPLVEFLRAKSLDHEITAVLYYNKQTGEWKPWVYPQEFGTGLSVRSLPDHPETDRQKRQYFPDESWTRAGTVHSHCKISAFQSATDEADERDIGLHITFGKIDQPVIDMHARFVAEHNGGAFPAALDTFFDIATLSFIPGPAPGVVMPNFSIEKWLTAARMEIPSWPKEWEANLIEKKQTKLSFSQPCAYTADDYYEISKHWAWEKTGASKGTFFDKFRGVLAKK